MPTLNRLAVFRIRRCGWAGEGQIMDWILAKTDGCSRHCWTFRREKVRSWINCDNRSVAANFNSNAFTATRIANDIVENTRPSWPSCTFFQ